MTPSFREPEPTQPPSGTPCLVGITWPPDHVGDYCLGRKLGEGGMGAVFEAEDQHLKRRAAVKVMLPAQLGDADARARFVREARLMAAVRHDNVVQVFAVGGQDAIPFIAMELLAGSTLADRLERHGAIPFAPAAVIARHTAEALAAAHAVGLVHRDVKPSNIWLEANADRTFKRVKLLDFGLTRPVDPGQEALTQTGAIVGTPAYMSPEQSHGKPVDARTDLFSLGVVLYEMLTGTRPFVGGSTLEILFNVSKHTPATASSVNPQIPPALSDLIERLLAKEPAGRPPSAQSVAEELRTVAKSVHGGAKVTDVPLIVAATPPPEVPETVVAPEPPQPSRRKLLLAVGVAVPVAVAGGYLAFGGREKKATPPSGLPVADPKVSAREWTELIQRRVGRVIAIQGESGRAFAVTPAGHMLALHDTATSVKLGSRSLEVRELWNDTNRPVMVLIVDPPAADWFALADMPVEKLLGLEVATATGTGRVTRTGVTMRLRPDGPEVDLVQFEPFQTGDGGPLVARDGTVVGLVVTPRDKDGKSISNVHGYALTLPQLRTEIDAHCPGVVWR